MQNFIYSVMKKATLFFIPLLLIGCYQEARIYHERRNSDEYLKAKVSQKQINDTTIHVTLRIKNTARFIAYNEVEWLWSARNTEKDSVCFGGGRIRKAEIKPKHSFTYEKNITCDKKITSFRVSTISGNPPVRQTPTE